MLTAQEALGAVSQAETDGRISATAAANIRRWLTEPPFAGYRDRLIEEIEAGTLAGARRRLLRSHRVRHRRPSRARCIRSAPTSSTRGRSPRAPAGWPTTSPPARGPTPPARASSRATPGTTRPSSPSSAPGPGRRRVQGLPLPRAPLDPPALLRGPPPEVRRRDHDHRLAQPPVGQRLQVLRRDRRPGHPARRRRHHRLRQGGLGPRDPREALRARAGRRLDRPPWHRGGRGATSRPSWASRSARPATSRSSTRRCTASARPRSPRRSRPPGSTKVNILASQRDARRRLPERARARLQPRDPPDARRLDRRGQGDGRRPGAGQRPRRRPDRRRPSPSPATPRGNGRRSTATRSASCWPPSS